jgi:hypothetical protein
MRQNDQVSWGGIGFSFQKVGHCILKNLERVPARSACRVSRISNFAD